eukprot:2495493-Prymnesium_polylepis.1
MRKCGVDARHASSRRSIHLQGSTRCAARGVVGGWAYWPSAWPNVWAHGRGARARGRDERADALVCGRARRRVWTTSWARGVARASRELLEAREDLHLHVGRALRAESVDELAQPVDCVEEREAHLPTPHATPGRGAGQATQAVMLHTTAYALRAHRHARRHPPLSSQRAQCAPARASRRR